MTPIIINVASVKVMRSHDYCHFEVQLSATIADGVEQVALVDELRKTAARLADKAVEQYKVAKLNAERLEQDARTHSDLLHDAERIEAKPEGERTPVEKAVLKFIQDLKFERRRYNYDDEWDEEEEWRPELPDGDEDPEF
jgi:hypothetical protein